MTEISYKLRVLNPVADAIRRQRMVERVLSRLGPNLNFTASATDRILRDGGDTAFKSASAVSAQNVLSAFQEAGADVAIINDYAASSQGSATQKGQSFGLRSLRWRTIGIALLPLALLGGLWLFDTFTAEANTVRRLVLEGGVQSVDFLSDRISAIAEHNGGQLDLAETQGVLKDLVQAAVLPVDFAVVTDKKGEIIAAYDIDFLEGTDPSDPVKAFKRLTTDESSLIETMARQTVQYSDPPSGEPTFTLSADDPVARQVATTQGEKLLFVGHPVESTGGAFLLSLHTATINEHINSSLRNTLLLLGMAMLVSLLAAWLFARGLIARLIGMAHNANQVSMGNFDVNIDTQSQDEIGEVGRSMDRMRTSLETAITRMSRR